MGKISKIRRKRHLNSGVAVLSIWQRLTRILVFFSVIGLGVLVFSVFAPEWNKLQAMDEENDLLKKRLENLKAERTERLQDELHTSNEIEYLEIVARDKLNLQLPGEVIFRIQR